MIARLQGILIQKAAMQCIVDVHGAGYRVAVPLSTFYELPENGQQVVLHIHTHVREDAIHLYGFHSEGEREVFDLLISVSGIGPKLAIGILSGIEASEWVRAVVEGDLRRLTGIPGVGRKTAERMVLELKEKATRLQGEGKLTGGAGPVRDEQLQDDALSALVNLGYKAPAAKEAIERICKTESASLTLDQLLKRALRILAG